MDEMNFDLAPVEVPVTINGERFVLREASEDAARRYENAGANSLRYNDQGAVIGVGDVAGVQSLLVSLCLCRTNEDSTIKTLPNGQPITVPQAVILSWPRRVTKALLARAKEISDLNESETVLLRQIELAKKKLKALRDAKGEPEKNSQDEPTES